MFFDIQSHILNAIISKTMQSLLHDVLAFVAKIEDLTVNNPRHINQGVHSPTGHSLSKGLQGFRGTCHIGDNSFMLNTGNGVTCPTKHRP